MWRANRIANWVARRAIRGVVVSALAVSCTGYAALGQAPAATPASGRVSLDLPDLPPATVEIDLGKGLIRHAISLGDAAVAGFLEGLMTSPNAESSENAQFVAQQLTTARELGDVVSDMVHEIHLRVWNDLPPDNNLTHEIFAHFDPQLSGSGWESAVRVRDDDEMVRIFVHRSGESLNGVLIIAGEDDELVLANVIGDLSPDKVKQLTSTATKIGVKLGLDKEINRAVEQLKREMDRAGH